MTDAKQQNVEWNKIVGKQIAARREEKGFSHRELGRLADVDFCTIKRMENGNCGCQAHTLYRLAKALSCSMDVFYHPIRNQERVKF